MNQTVTSFKLDDGKYFVLDKIVYQNKTYLYLFKEDNPKDFLIQEYRKETPNQLYGIKEEDYFVLLNEFRKHHKEA